MRRIVIWLIRFYQKHLSRLKSAPSCRYYPTCSQYTLTAVEKHGVIKGLILGFWRILRCNPYSGGGVDYVPDKFHLYTLKSERRRIARERANASAKTKAVKANGKKS